MEPDEEHEWMRSDDPHYENEFEADEFEPPNDEDADGWHE